ncbi:DUF3488 and DUF4129 domain-containing transglutaminase family protein [soil metagenome]
MQPNPTPTAAPVGKLVPHWPGWRHLPRDARDTLFLLAVIGWTVMPHAGHLPWWCTLLTVGVLVWRARLAVANAPLPGRWALVGVLLAIAAMTLIDFRTFLGKDAGVTLLVALVALKTLELRARRDAFVVFFLGFFLILTQFLYSQTLGSAAAMLISIWGLLTALVLAHMPVGRPPLKRAGVLAARTALLGAPIMVLLFVLFPRVGPLWGLPQDDISRTGLSNSMQMGTVAELALDDSVAMRLRFLGAEPAPESLYFRGPVLSKFDGREWTPLPVDFGRPVVPTQLRVAGEPIRYEMTLEPSRVRVLPLLEAAPRAPEVDNMRVRLTDDLQWVTSRPIGERLRLTADAYLDFRHGPTTSMLGLRSYVELPPGFNPRTLAWAADFRREPRYANADARTLARALLQRIATGGYQYTLTPGEYGSDAVDEFWLDRKAGFCEHFAATFVVIMRALDVPARVVTGYQGAERNPVDGYYLVRQSSAHAWAEYWQEGVGWIRADPTAAVAPDRVTRSRNLTPAPGLVAGTLGTMNPALWARVRNLWEATNNGWNQWVLSYSRTQQFGILERLGFSAPSWEDLARLLAGAFAVLALGGSIWAWMERRRQDPWERQTARLHAVLADMNIDVAAFRTPRELAARLRLQYGANGVRLAQQLEALERQRYSREAQSLPTRGFVDRFKAEARSVKRQGPER